MAATSSQVTLERDGHDQPWGFRLQGGVDVGLPLSVLRVLVGSPSETVLHKGDLVVKIGTQNTNSMTHQQAVDAFERAGNKLNVLIRRSGNGAAAVSTSQPGISALQASVARQQHQQQQQQSPVPGEVSAAPADLKQSAQVAALPRTTFVLKSSLPQLPTTAKTNNDSDISLQNQPYRTLPLVQPSVKVLNELGAGSYAHLRHQEEIISREPQLVPITPAQADALRANEYIMKQKTQQVVVEAASDHQKGIRNSPHKVTEPTPAAGPIPGPTPVKLPPSPSLPANFKPSLSVAPQPVVAPAPPKASASVKPSVIQPVKKTVPTGMINPSSGSSVRTAPLLKSVNKPPKTGPMSVLSLRYDPEQSATWQAIHEQENCQLITEHGPTESKVYSI